MDLHRDLAHILPPTWRSSVKSWLEEDLPSFDIGGYVVGDRVQTATLLGKSPGFLAGVPFFTAVFEELGCTVEWLLREGDEIVPISDVARVTGPVNKLLIGERTALNIITRACGIATQARKAAILARNAEWHGEIAGTRKTTPGFRLVEKYALLVGGCSTHRYDLSSMVMLKDNHIWSTGSITEAVKAAKRVSGFSTKIEVETRTLEEAREAASAGADIVMLDNKSPEGLFADAAALKAEFPKVIIEGSGGITIASLPTYFNPNIDVLSMGSLTQGYPAVDLSLKLPKPASVSI